VRTLGALLLLAALAAIVATGCGGGGDRETAGGSGRLVALSSVAPVAETFDDDKGRPRLLVLLSPT
jgi:hypothetical protein